MLKKHLFCLTLVSSSMTCIYAMEKKKYKTSQYVRSPKGKVYKISQDHNDQTVILTSTSKKNPIVMKARRSDGDKSQIFTDVSTAEVISMTIISKNDTNLPKEKKKKGTSKRKKKRKKSS